MRHGSRVVAWVTCGVLLAQPVMADLVVLKVGEKYDGMIANREDVRVRPRSAPTIGILLRDSGILKRFSVEDIEYIILEDAERNQVIDFLSLALPGTISAPSVTVGSKSEESGGVGYVVSGLVVGAVGIFAKLGGARVSLTENSLTAERRTYTVVNYLLMGLGGFLVAVGIGKEAARPAIVDTSRLTP